MGGVGVAGNGDSSSVTSVVEGVNETILDTRCLGGRCSREGSSRRPRGTPISQEL